MEMENKISSIIGLSTNSPLTTVNVNNLVKKKQTITQKLVKLKRKLVIIIMTNVLLLQNSIN